MIVYHSSKCCLNIIKKGTARMLSTNRTFEEVKVPMPFGHLTGKWWAPHDTRPILAMHGWQDNAGTFDRIIPYLPANIGILALDFPGHGLSSHLPKGSFYHSADAVTLYKRIIKYFNWSKVSFMGHSFGAASNVSYTMLYPDDVDILVCLDGFYFVSKTKAKPEVMAKTIDEFLKYDNINNNSVEPPSFTLEDLRQKMYIGSKQSVNVEHADYILQRNITPVKNKPGMFYMNRDIRLKVSSVLQWSMDMVLTGATRIKCPVFLSMGNNSYFCLKQLENFKNLFKIIEKHNKHCYFYELDGTHHVHVNAPEKLGGLVNEFLLKHYSNDNK